MFKIWDKLDERRVASGFRVLGFSRVYLEMFDKYRADYLLDVWNFIPLIHLWLMKSKQANKKNEMKEIHDSKNEIKLLASCIRISDIIFYEVRAASSISIISFRV